MKTTPSSRRRGRVLLCFSTAAVLVAATPVPASANPPGLDSVPAPGASPDGGASPESTPEPGAEDPTGQSDTPQLGPGIQRGPYASQIAEMTSAVARLGEDTNAAADELEWRKDVTESARSEFAGLQKEAEATADLAGEMAVNAYQSRAAEIPNIDEKFAELFKLNPALLDYDAEAIAAEADSAAESSAAAQATLDAAKAAEEIADGNHSNLKKDLDEQTTELEQLIEANTAAIEEQEESDAVADRLEGGDIGSAADGSQPGDAANEAVEFALRQEGKPYEWGAVGPETYDCSGLTQDAYGSLGVEIPRVSFDQFRSTSTESVDVEKMLPGDLIFYGDVPGDWTSVYHVAMYIGDGEMVHAPRPGDVVRVAPVSFDEFVGAHRVVDPEDSPDLEPESDGDNKDEDEPQPAGPPPDKPRPQDRPSEPDPGRQPGSGGGDDPAPQPTPTPTPG